MIVEWDTLRIAPKLNFEGERQCDVGDQFEYLEEFRSLCGCADDLERPSETIDVLVLDFVWKKRYFVNEGQLEY